VTFDPNYEGRIKYLSDMLYEVCDKIFEQGLVTDLQEFDIKIRNWYFEKRNKVLEEENAEKMAALAKLTDREKKLLGIK
jgi:hypothetical protein